MRLRLLLMLLLSVGSLVGLGSVSVSAGKTLYPDLQMLPPTDLAFDQISGGTWVLRFGSTVGNAGPGRLELEGKPNTKPHTPQKVYQNLYDAAGTRTSHRAVATDTVFHPDHDHYHFTRFSSTVLLARDAGSTRYRETKKKGAKTSFCIVDSYTMPGAETDPLYTTCETKQGLTPGWSDTYDSDVAGQWVVLGDTEEPLKDGEYALRSTVDPRNLLDEGGRKSERNNTAVIYFTVSAAGIENVRNAP
jgi:hypothetical protein